MKPTTMSHREQLAFRIEEGCCRGGVRHIVDAGEEQLGSHRASDGMRKGGIKGVEEEGLGDLGRNKHRNIEGYRDKKGRWHVNSGWSVHLSVPDHCSLSCLVIKLLSSSVLGEGSLLSVYGV